MKRVKRKAPSKNKPSNYLLHKTSLSKDKKFITVNEILEGPDVPIKLIAKTEDWKIIREYYLLHKKEVFRDFFPFMQEAYLKAQKQTTHRRNQPFVQIMKVQAGLLYGFLSHILKKPFKSYPGSLKAIKIDPDDREKLQKRDNRDIDPGALTLYLMELVYQDWIKYNKLSFAFDNFKTTYIYDGEKIIKSDRRACKEAIRAIHSILYFIKTKEIIKTKYAFDFLFNLSTAININYKFSENPEIKLQSIKNTDELDSIKNDIEDVFPSLKKDKEEVFPSLL